MRAFLRFIFSGFSNRFVSQYFAHVGVRGNYYELCDQVDFTKWLEYFTDKIYSSLNDRAKATRNQDFNRLIEMGWIERVGKGKATIYRMK
jgi:hypothetical protein